GHPPVPPPERRFAGDAGVHHLAPRRRSPGAGTAERSAGACLRESGRRSQDAGPVASPGAGVEGAATGRTRLNPPCRRSRSRRGGRARRNITTKRHDASAVTLIRTVRIVFTPIALQPLHHPAGGPPPHDRFAATGRIGTGS